MKYHSNISQKANIHWTNIYWTYEIPPRVKNYLSLHFGKEFDLNKKENRDKVIKSNFMQDTPNFGKKSWEYLINYIKYRWPEDNNGKPPQDFKIVPRYGGLYRTEKRNLQIFIDRESGMTYSAIGEKHNISSDRARQIAARIYRNRKYLTPYYEQF